MIATNFKHYTKNTLLGFFDLELPSRMTIKGCTLHRKSDGDRWWVGLPAKEFKKEDGTIGYSNIIEFKEKENQYKFGDAAVVAARQAFEQTPQPRSEKPAPDQSSRSRHGDVGVDHFGDSIPF